MKAVFLLLIGILWGVLLCMAVDIAVDLISHSQTDNPCMIRCARNTFDESHTDWWNFPIVCLITTADGVITWYVWDIRKDTWVGSFTSDRQPLHFKNSHEMLGAIRDGMLKEKLKELK